MLDLCELILTCASPILGGVVPVSTVLFEVVFWSVVFAFPILGGVVGMNR